MAGYIEDESDRGRQSEKNYGKTKRVKDFAEFIKIEHTIFDLPFIVSGSFIAANGFPGIKELILVLFAGSLARAAGMSINRILGRKYDIINPRKKNWALVNNSISLRNTLILTAFLIFLFEIDVFFINNLVLLLSPVVIILFLIDPVLKRYTQWRHFFMGLTIGVGVMAGYLAVTPHFPLNPEIYYLVLATGTWIAGFDMIYTIQDVEVDRINGLKTVMSIYGIRKGLIISDITHAFTILLFGLMIISFNSIYYDVAFVIISILIVYQHLIISEKDTTRTKASFFNSNSFIGIIFLASIILSEYSRIKIL
ncbi:UbiA-like polyprenyltransferase [Caldiplasma sukawensis]